MQAELMRLAAVLRHNTPLRNVLDEVVAIVPKVVSWNIVPTSGFAICRYNTMTGKPAGYEISYQQGNMGNVVHELIHAAVNEAYEQDFVNYPNPNPMPAPPARTYDGMGRCTNEFDRQTRFMTTAGNSEVASNLNDLIRWTNASLELTMQQRMDIVSKFNYGLQWPHKEYDTVITQVLIWLYEWGYPIISDNPQGKKPVVNALYEELTKAVDKAYKMRRAG